MLKTARLDLRRLSLLFFTTVCLSLSPTLWPNGLLGLRAALPPQIVLNQIGYGLDWQKQAFLMNGSDSSVQVLDQSGRTVLVIKPQPAVTATSGDHIQVLDFSALKTPGQYRLSAGPLQSVRFHIGPNPYQAVSTQLLHSYYLQRCGIEIRDSATGIRHAPCHLKDGVLAHPDSSRATGLAAGQIIAGTGGWHDAGDYGKYVATATVTIGRLLNTYERQPSQFKDAQLAIPESGNGIPDLLDEMRVGLDWLLTQQRPDGAVYRKLSGKQWPIGQAPDEDTQSRYIYGVSTPETAKFAATMAMAARMYRPLMPERARQYQTAAVLAWQYLEQHPAMAVDWQDGDDSGSGKYLFSDIDNEDSLKRDDDDRLWAAAELWITLGGPRYEQYFADHVRQMDYTLFEWKDPSSLGMLDYLQQSVRPAKPELKALVRTKLLLRADRLLKAVEQDPYRLANQRLIWGSNKMTLEEGITLLNAYRITRDLRYLEASRDQIHFILGRNPFNQTFVSGVGTHPVKHVNNLFARAKNIDISGLLVGGPNQGAQDGIAPKNAGVLSYIDDAKSYATNEHAIDYNAALVALIHLQSS
jgi:endoglucanase